MNPSGGRPLGWNPHRSITNWSWTSRRSASRHLHGCSPESRSVLNWQYGESWSLKRQGSFSRRAPGTQFSSPGPNDCMTIVFANATQQEAASSGSARLPRSPSCATLRCAHGTQPARSWHGSSSGCAGSGIIGAGGLAFRSSTRFLPCLSVLRPIRQPVTRSCTHAKAASK